MQTSYKKIKLGTVSRKHNIITIQSIYQKIKLRDKEVIARQNLIEEKLVKGNQVKISLFMTILRIIKTNYKTQL